MSSDDLFASLEKCMQQSDESFIRMLIANNREIEAKSRELERMQLQLQKLEEENPVEKRLARAERRAREAAIARSNRIQELKDAFEKSGHSHNSAAPEEVETLLTLTEKKIIQQCRRPKCHGCKLGWICPKYWSES